METPDELRGMPWHEAVRLAEEIRAMPWYRVHALTDRAYYPDNWSIAVSYHPRKPNGSVSGSRYSRFVRSRGDWQRFQIEAVEANTRGMKRP